MLSPGLHPQVNSQTLTLRNSSHKIPHQTVDNASLRKTVDKAHQNHTIKFTIYTTKGIN